MTLKSKFAAVLTVAGLLAGLLVGLAAPAASAAVVQVSATVETAPIHGSGDAADDPAIWIHPTDPSKSTIIGTDKSTDGHGLVVYDLSGRELFYYPDGRMNNVDVRYNFPLGSSRVGLVGASNRVRSLDFYKVNESDRSLTKVGSFAPTANIATPRGFSFYHSPETGKYFAYVTDIGKVEQWELDGSTGSVTGRLVRSWTVSGPAHTEGLVADDEMKRFYIAQEDIGGIWRYGAEPGDSTAGTKVVSTTENGGDIVQDIKGISIYYGSGGAGYLLAASQGSNRFHVYARDDNRPLGAFAIPAGNGIDAVTGMDGIDVTNFGVGGPFPQGFFITQDHVNDTGNQNFKLVPWQSIAAAYAPALLVDAAYDPRKIGAGTTTPDPPDTTITSKPANPTSSTSAQFSFTSTSTSATFACSLDSAAFVNCISPVAYAGLSDGAHTFQVRASDQNGVDPTPASYTWTVDTAPPEADTTPPETTITSGPPATSTSTSASFAFTSSEANSTFQCSLDGASSVACTSPQTYTGLSIGSHTFGVWATDAAGNTDGTAATQTWSVGPSDTGGGIVRESVSQATNTAASTTLTIPTPANVAQGDLLVSCVSLNGGSIAATGVPTDWTPLAAVTTIATPKVYGYYKVATGSEPTDYVWTTSSTKSGGGIARYSGASGLDGVATSASGAAASSGTIPAVTSTSANAMLVGCMSVNSGSVTLTPPAGMAQAVETGARRFEVADGIQAIAGPSGAKTWTFSAAREWAGWLVALRPKTAPPPSAPVASFTATPTSGTAPLNVAFTDTSTGSPTSWSWDFGDGGTSTAQSPAHTYTAAGTYTAALTATNGTGSGSTSSTITVSPEAAGAVPTYDHIVIVILENQSYQNVIGNSTAPYINSIANSIGVNLTNAYAEAHPSQPNYVALFSGSTQGVTDDSSSYWPFTGPNMYSQLAAAGKTFSGYSEGLISGVNWLAYHSPWLHWTGVPASAGQDWTAFPTDYTKLPNVSIVAPDSCNSMHDCPISTGDTWLQNNLGAYATWAKTHNSLLYVTFDEDGGVGGSTSVNHIPAVMTGANLNSPGSYSTTFNHYGVLGMVADSNGLPRLNNSVGAAFPTAAFSTTTSTAPVASFTATPTSGTAPLDVAFTDTSTGSPTSWSWAFGDGGTSTAQNPAHTYTAAGTYTATLTASNDGGSGPTSSTITVSPAPPPADTTPPETTITSGPPATSTSTSASFAFSSSEANSTFQCSLDGASRVACTSPQTYTGLSIGSHTFGVWGTDAAGNTDATAATQTWSVGPSDTGGGSGIVRESVSQATNTAASTTLTIPQPAGVAQGDLLVSCLSLNGGSIAATGVPTGWTPLAAVTTIANPKVYGYYKVATGSESASYSWTTTSTTSGGGIARYSGAGGLDGVATSASGAAASSGTVPAVTSTSANAMLVGCMSVNSGSVTLTSPTGMAQAVETGARRFEVADGIQAIAGPSGAKTWTFSAAREWAGWLVALRPKTP